MVLELKLLLKKQPSKLAETIIKVKTIGTTSKL
jgi:hypothetical protein